MAGASFHEDEPDPKRRKIRKGTQSCWECRRRKVRCISADNNDAKCNNCRRRGTLCISQEHPDEPTPSDGSNQVEARLGRVEKLIEQLVKGTVSPPKSTYPVRGRSESRLAQFEPGPLAGRTSDPFVSIPTPTTSELGAEASFNGSTGNAAVPKSNYDPFTRESTHQRPPSKQHPPVIATPAVQNRGAAWKYEDISRALIAAWPSQHDIDLICTLPVGLSAMLYRGICTPYSTSMGQDPPSPREILQLPPPGSHPVLIARQLLVLGTYLQGILPSSIKELAELVPSYLDIMSRVVDTAVRLVTTNEDLIGSVEGILCIMVESMYQNYAGKLHRAWMAIRRTTTVAQMMALHRGLKSPSLKFLDPETRTYFDPDQVCFRIVEMDRYLSIMLGLPPTSLEARFATPKALEGCQPIDRMQRIHVALADRILQRNENNLSETQEIDMLVQKAASEMPPQWWLIPNASANTSNGTEILHETIRMMDHFTHYHLLIRLHLPYMLRSSPDHKHNHSKFTCVNASRETLSRFIALRTSNPGHFYCRGTDFLAFVATTVLCLAHIDSRSQTSGFNFLGHSRPTDRGMMERSLSIIEDMVDASNGTDAISVKVSRILRHLLTIEVHAADGRVTYHTTGTSQDEDDDKEEELELHGNPTPDGRGLYIYIPHFGRINFLSSSSSSKQPNHNINTSRINRPMAPEPQPETTTTWWGLGRPSLVFASQPPPPPPPLGGVDVVLDPYPQIGSRIGTPTTSPTPHPSTAPNNPVPSNIPAVFNEDLNQAHFDWDWDLQGVDTALFDTLFTGLDVPIPAPSPNPPTMGDTGLDCGGINDSRYSNSVRGWVDGGHGLGGGDFI